MSNPLPPHFKYDGSNIVIVPTVSFCGPLPKKPKFHHQNQVLANASPDKNSIRNTEDSKITKDSPITIPPNNNSCVTNENQSSTLVNNNIYVWDNKFNTPPCTDPGSSTQENQCLSTTNPTNNKYKQAASKQENQFSEDVKYSNTECDRMVQKTLSWASNYLRSIGQCHSKASKHQQSTIPIQQKIVTKDGERRENCDKKLNSFNQILKPKSSQYISNTFKHYDASKPQESEQVINDAQPIKLNLLNDRKNITSENTKSRSSKLYKNITKIRNKDSEITMQRHDAKKYKSENKKHSSAVSPTQGPKSQKHIKKSEKGPLVVNKSRRSTSINKKVALSKDSRDEKYVTKHSCATKEIEKRPRTHDKKLDTRNKICKKHKYENKHKNADHSKILPEKYMKPICQEKYKSKSSQKKTTSEKNETLDKSEHLKSKKKCDERKSTPIKSKVQVTESFDLKLPSPPKTDCIAQDLRNKLKRKHSNFQDTMHDNLLITVQNESGSNKMVCESKESKFEEQAKTRNKTHKLKPETRKFKKIKLTINLEFEKCSESSESESDGKSNDHQLQANVDLSFLDDFNVDDIVKCLSPEVKDHLNLNVSESRKSNYEPKIEIKKLTPQDDEDINKNLVKLDSKSNDPRDLRESDQFEPKIKQETNAMEDIISDICIAKYSGVKVGTKTENDDVVLQVVKEEKVNDNTDATTIIRNYSTQIERFIIKNDQSSNAHDQGIENATALQETEISKINTEIPPPKLTPVNDSEIITITDDEESLGSWIIVNDSSELPSDPQIHEIIEIQKDDNDCSQFVDGENSLNANAKETSAIDGQESSYIVTNINKELDCKNKPVSMDNARMPLNDTENNITCHKKVFANIFVFTDTKNANSNLLPCASISSLPTSKETKNFDEKNNLNCHNKDVSCDNKADFVDLSSGNHIKCNNTTIGAQSIQEESNIKNANVKTIEKQCINAIGNKELPLPSNPKANTKQSNTTEQNANKSQIDFAENEDEKINANTTYKQKLTDMNKSKPGIEKKPTIVNAETPTENVQTRPDINLPINKYFLWGICKRMVDHFGVKYNFTAIIRRGKFSKVFECQDLQGRKYALKVMNKKHIQSEVLKEGVLHSIQKDIPKKNFHCISVIGDFWSQKRWCLLMEYYPKNLQVALADYGKSFHIDMVQTLSRQLVSAILVLRNNSIAHLGIKPEHILLNSTNNKLKLAGFDEAQYLDNIKVLPNLGTVSYRPPEMILGYPNFTKVDVWAAALVLYEMTTNTKLFPGCYNNDILFQQQCVLGAVPPDMLDQSMFKTYHYNGMDFLRYIDRKKTVIVPQFFKTNRLIASIFTTYHKDWGQLRTKKEKFEDNKKLRLFKTLLLEMLAIHPRDRLPVEFAYTNQFIYESFHSVFSNNLVF